MATLTKEESEQMAELLSKPGYSGTSRHSNFDRFDQSSTKSKKRKRKRSKRKDYLLELTASTLMKKMRKGRERPLSCQNLTWFCGQTPIPKGHVSFEAWKHEVKGLMKLYDTQVVIQSIRRSLRSPTAEVVWCLGIEASYEDIMDALETQYDDITETEALLSELSLTTQGEKESVPEFGGRLHSIQYKIKQSQGDKGRKDENDEFVQQNFF